MSNTVIANGNNTRDLKTFIENNQSKIYANTPTVSSISINDDWATETEWDELFRELSTKEKYGLLNFQLKKIQVKYSIDLLCYLTKTN